VLERTTAALLDRVGIRPDAECLDVGCGGGDVTAMLARRVPAGRVVGTDRDRTKIALARAEVPANVTLRTEDIGDTVASGDTYDVVYARFLLSHLAAAAGWVAALSGLVRSGGVLVLEDVRISGAFWSPPSPTFDRAVEIYAATVRANGGDPELGPHLPRHLAAAGLVDIGIEVVQPAALSGDSKRIQLLTLLAIRESAVAAGVTEAAEIDRLADEMVRFVDRSDTVVSTAQIVQTWGRKPSM
jgi:2-polyprenyl-3-methyl-5-hydroxy-6-metoxy-1,4-benzoquinol methylase